MAKRPRELWRSWTRMFIAGVLAAAPLACMEVAVSKSRLAVAPANLMCPIGSQGCPCTAGGGCDPGLVCDAGICVSEAPITGDYDFAEDMVDMEAPAPAAPPPVASKKASKRRARHERSSRKNLAGAAAAETTTVSESPQPAQVAEPAPEGPSRDPADEVDNARQVVYTAVLQVAVYHLDPAAELAESLPQKYGGWIESRSDYRITLRIRAEHLFEAIEELSALGLVLDKQLHAEDVTAEYVDLESRIRVLEELVAHLEALLARANSVELALEIRRALDQARLELEAARARMRQLMELVDFSTLTLILSQRGPAELPSSNDPFPWVDELGVEITEYR